MKGASFSSRLKGEGERPPNSSSACGVESKLSTAPFDHRTKLAMMRDHSRSCGCKSGCSTAVFWATMRGPEASLAVASFAALALSISAAAVTTMPPRRAAETITETDIRIVIFCHANIENCFPHACVGLICCSIARIVCLWAAISRVSLATKTPLFPAKAGSQSAVRCRQSQR